MNRYLPIKIDSGSHDYLIDLYGNTWADSGLPVSKMTEGTDHSLWFRLHICRLLKAGDEDVPILSEYVFITGKKVAVEFMGKTYHPGDSDFELIKLHNALETELALVSLD